MLERRPLDLTPLLKEQKQLLERTLPENIEISMVYRCDECIINADPTRIQQVVMNLVLNARDAMPQGGQVRIELDRLEVREGEPAPILEMNPGLWVRVAIVDTGVGIPADALPRIFEPFYTTKAPGKGSGLGLPQVYGIVRQHEGFIDVESGEGQGTTVTLYLPARPASTAAPVSAAAAQPARGAGETLLVVEDDQVTRAALVDSLEMLGYCVIPAANGQEALAILEERRDEVAVMLSDVVMPGMGGVALLETLVEKGLTVPTVMLTGHPLEEDLNGLLDQELITAWLHKPLGMEQLAEVVARVLQGG
jgi:CheY-like chemotaxis protein